jgi:hypothetical protein
MAHIFAWHVMAVTIPTSKATFEYAVNIRIVSFQNYTNHNAKTHEQASSLDNDEVSIENRGIFVAEICRRHDSNLKINT